jgi:hypothetical protein
MEVNHTAERGRPLLIDSRDLPSEGKFATSFLGV